MIEVNVSSGTVGVEGSSGSASPSGAVCSAIMGEKVNGGCGALGVTGVVVSSTVSGIN
jgi:predicted ATP-dependent protease